MAWNRSLTRVTAISLCLAWALPTLAHEVTPDPIEMFPGEWRELHVIDPGTCSATVGASIADAGVATLTPDFGVGIDVAFTVTAGMNPGMTDVIINWVGEDVGGEGPCQEDVKGYQVRVIVKPFPEPESSANNENSGASGDPVNTYNGELVLQEEPDLVMDGPMPLVFQRYYASHLRRAFIVGDVGNSWRHSYEWRVYWVGNVLYLVTHEGKVLLWLKQNDEWVLQTRTDSPFQIVQDNNEIVIGDPDADRIYRFNGGGQLMEIRDSRGNVHSLEYGGNNKLETVSDGLGRSMSFSYDFNDKLTGVQARTRSVSLTYSGDELSTYTDPEGRITSYVYDGGQPDSGLMIRRVAPMSNAPWSQTYDNLDRVDVQTDAYGNEYVFGYASNTSVTQPSLNLYSHTHDQSGNQTRFTSPSGMAVDMASGSNRRTLVTGVGGGNYLYSYDAVSGKLASETDEAGNRTQYAWSRRLDPSGVTFFDLASVTYADGSSEQFTRNGGGQVTSYSDRAGAQWMTTFNGQGQALSVTNPLGGVTSHVYDGEGKLQTRTDAAGKVTTYAYGSLGELTSITYPDGNTKSWTYNRVGQVTSVTDERGKLWSYGYNENHRLISVTEPVTGSITYSYDLMDRLSGITDASGRASSASYDDEDQLLSVSNRTANNISYGRDVNGRIDEVLDADGASWKRSHGPDGHVSRYTTPTGRGFALERNPAGEILGVTTPEGRIYSSTRDAMGRVTSMQDPTGRTTSFSYDGRGDLTQVSADSGTLVTDIERDAMGNVTKVTSPGGEQWLHTYDSAGRLLSRTDPLSQTTTYGYTDRSWLMTTTFPGTMGALTTTRDASGNVTKRDFDDGTVIDMVYDDKGRRTSANNLSLGYDARDDLTSCNGLSMTRDDNGHIDTLTFASTKTITYGYNARGLVTSVMDWAGGGVTISYDDDRRPLTFTRTNSVTTTMTWDDDGFAASIREGAISQIGIQRDATGRATAVTRDVPQPMNFSLGTTNTSFTGGSRVDGFSYDDLGRLTADSDRSYAWNLSGTLKQYDDGNVPVDFTYDGFGLPVSRSEGGTTDDYVWNYAFELPALSVVRRSAADLRYYVHLPDGTLLYSIDAVGEARRFYHYDEMGNTVFLTDDGGSVTDSYAYTPYGQVLAASGSSENPFTFAGRFGVMQEGSDGLYIMRKRFYDAESKRFLSRDRKVDVVHPFKVNPYQYALGDPARWVDPTGEDAKAWTAQGANAVGAGKELSDTLQAGAGTLKEAFRGSAPAIKAGSKLASALGPATVIVTNVVEIMETDEDTERYGNQFRAENEASANRMNGCLDLLRRKYKQGKINHTQYRERRRACLRLWHSENEEHQRNYTDQMWNEGVETTIDIVYNALPFGSYVTMGVEAVYTGNIPFP